MKKGMPASSFQKLLIFFICVVIALTAAGFYYGLTEVRKLAVQVNNKVEDSRASGDQIDELRRLQQTLTQSDTLVQKANRMFTTESAFTSDAVRDLEKYAAVSGVRIENQNSRSRRSARRQLGNGQIHPHLIGTARILCRLTTVCAAH